MKRVMLFAGISALISLCLTGCLGKGKDTIGISKSSVNTGASAQTVELTAEGSFEIDVLYYSTETEGVEIYDTTINKDFVNNEYDYTGPWFTIRTSENKHRLIIGLEENTSGMSRHFRIQLYAKDFTQWVSVIQDAE